MRPVPDRSLIAAALLPAVAAAIFGIALVAEDLSERGEILDGALAVLGAMIGVPSILAAAACVWARRRLPTARGAALLTTALVAVLELVAYAAVLFTVLPDDPGLLTVTLLVLAALIALVILAVRRALAARDRAPR